MVHNIFAQDSLSITLQDISKEQQRCMAANPDLFRFPNDSTVNLQWADLEHGPENCKVLVDVTRNQQRIFIPPRYENLIIDHYHNTYHLGVRATQRFICDRYLFPTMKRKIGDRVRACSAYERTKVVRQVVSPISSAKVPKSRFTTAHADLCSPYPECQGFSYLLVCIDRFTRFVSVYLLRNFRTKSAIIGINSHVATFGQMQTLRVDNGVQWTFKLFRDYCKFLGCDLCNSNTRYPESNGLVERAIKNIKVALTAKLDRENWMFYVGSIVLSLNSMFREELGCSSADLVFFQALRLPGDICYSTIVCNWIRT